MSNGPFLIGWDMIGSHCKVNARTVMEWEISDGFPVARIRGNVITTSGLIERWIIKNLKNPKVRGGMITENRKKRKLQKSCKR